MPAFAGIFSLIIFKINHDIQFKMQTVNRFCYAIAKP